MTDIHECVVAVRQCQKRQWMWRCVSTGLLIGGASRCVFSVLRIVEWGQVSWARVIAALLAGPVAGGILSLVRRQSERDAAAAIDRKNELKDRIVTAIGLLKKNSLSTVWRELQLVDARQHLTSFEPKEVAPIRAPKSWNWGLGLRSLAVVLALFSPPTDNATASVAPNDVVAQALTVESGLKELEEFNSEEIDHEIVEYLKSIPSVEELEGLVNKLGIEPQGLMRTGESIYKELGLAKRGLSRIEALQLLHEHPKLIERPIVAKGSRAVLGRPPENVTELL